MAAMPTRTRATRAATSASAAASTIAAQSATCGSRRTTDTATTKPSRIAIADGQGRASLAVLPPSAPRLGRWVGGGGGLALHHVGKLSGELDFARLTGD